MRASDQELIGVIVFQLTMDERINGSRIDVLVEDGQAYLHGTVISPNAKIAAEEDAAVVLGINTVHNHLTIIPPLGYISR